MRTALVITQLVAALVTATLVLGGCVRSVTVCAQYDRALSAPDPNTGLARHSAGTSVCVEGGPQ